MLFFQFILSCMIPVLGICTINTKNSVYSILFLILLFINATGLLLTFNIEFIAIMFIIIYVGAIAVLFLFVIMMLDIKINQKQKFNYSIICLFLGSMLFIETCLSISFSEYLVISDYREWFLLIDKITNIETIGQVLYSFYLIYFLIAGIILLIALIGAVTLTLNKTKTEKNFSQISRYYNNSMFLLKNR